MFCWIVFKRRIKNIIVVQNKIDLVSREKAIENHNKIKDFLNTHGTFITTDPFKFESIIGRLTSKFSKKSFLSVIVDSNGFDLKIIKDWIEEEKIKVFIDKKYNFSETKKAYNHLETQRVKGKIVVQMDH